MSARNKEVTADIVLVAAGKGQRMGHSRNKIFLELGEQPIYRLTFSAVQATGLFGRILIAASPNDIDDLRDGLPSNSAEIIAGGATRADSVRRALAWLQEAGAADFIFVHDIVRPFINKELLLRLIDGAAETGASAPAVSPVETVRAFEGGKLRLVPRENVYLMQTPQVFKSKFIADCFLAEDAAALDLTDDIAYLERRGIECRLVQGLAENIKITGPGDFSKAEAILKNWNHQL